MTWHRLAPCESCRARPLRLDVPLQQATNGACYSLGSLAQHSVVPLAVDESGRVGVTVALEGCNSCGGGVSRAIFIDVCAVARKQGASLHEHEACLCLAPAFACFCIHNNGCCPMCTVLLRTLQCLGTSPRRRHVPAHLYVLKDDRLECTCFIALTCPSCHLRKSLIKSHRLT